MEHQELSNTWTRWTDQLYVRTVGADSIPEAPEPRTRAVPDSFPLPECEGDIGRYVEYKEKGKEMRMKRRRRENPQELCNLQCAHFRKVLTSKYSPLWVMREYGVCERPTIGMKMVYYANVY